MTKTLTTKQLKAIAMLAEGQQPVDVAATLNVSRRTVERWLDKPEFRAQIDSAKAKATELLAQEIFEKCHSALTKGLPRAVRQVINCLDHPDARIQIRAAEAIAKWSGFYQPNKPTTSEQTASAEQNLQGYLAYLETTNGNGQHNPVR